MCSEDPGPVCSGLQEEKEGEENPERWKEAEGKKIL